MNYNDTQEIIVTPLMGATGLETLEMGAARIHVMISKSLIAVLT